MAWEGAWAGAKLAVHLLLPRGAPQAAHVLSILSFLKCGCRPGRDFQMLIWTSSEILLGASCLQPGNDRGLCGHEL